MKEFNKIIWKPGNVLYPLPAVMVSCGSTAEEYNIITISWTGTINTDPPMLYISVRPERHSYDIIKRNMEFVLNLTNEKLAKATDFNGVRSGREYDKFVETKLTPIPGRKVNTVMIGESPVNIECKVKDIIHLGSHDMFIADVVNVNIDEKLIDPKTNKLRLDKSNLLVYSHSFYYILGKRIGHFGYSVKKKKAR
jgi:flavin reductase (DIM6/NTAB) family NADH-FMN oxidoreductase RutF